MNPSFLGNVEGIGRRSFTGRDRCAISTPRIATHCASHDHGYWMLAVPALLRSASIAFSFLLPAAIAADSGPLNLLRQLDEGFVQVFEKVAPSVVVIEAEKKRDDEDADDAKGFEFFFQGEKEPRREGGERQWKLPNRSEGSGIVFRSDGYILTNFHVVADAESIKVRLRDGRNFPAKIFGVDEKTDIAIIHIEAKDLTAAQIGDSDRVRVGQLICAIGTPFNQAFSFSVGWISGKGRTNLLSPTSSTVIYEDYLQTDAFINPGNSGGPLFDVGGQVIGMNTLINGIGRGLAFAIPSNMFQEVAAELMTSRKVQRAWLGVRIETLSEHPMLRERLQGIEQGVVVETIEPNAPAYKSDLRPTDVITAVDGVKVTAKRELQKEILKKKVGVTVQLSVWRDGTTLIVPVMTGELPNDPLVTAKAAPPKPGMNAKAESLGLTLRDAKPTGALVAGVAPGSPADRAQMRNDDVIAEVDGRAVKDAATAAAAIGDRIRVTHDKALRFSIDRSGNRIFVVITPEA